ncbi:MAG: hypothetical protein O7D86_07975 [Proteobacteria bacterium]|nr:hypothetical protein [Pseudomonadota bacterium]
MKRDDILDRAVIPFDFAMGLWMIGCTSDMFDIYVIKIGFQLFG